MLNRLAVVALFAFALICLACASGKKVSSPTAEAPKDETPEPTREVASPNKPIRPGDKPAPPVATSSKFKIGQPCTVDDLTITIKDAITLQVAGLYHGQFASMNVLVVRFDVKNNSVGKITNWTGWQGNGVVVDEFGNKFSPIATSGWVNLPDNQPFGPHGDYGTRINPGQTYSEILFFEPVPASSHSITITLPVNGQDFKCSGAILTVEERRKKEKEAADKAAAEAEKARLTKLAEEKKTRPAVPEASTKIDWTELRKVAKGNAASLQKLNGQFVDVKGMRGAADGPGTPRPVPGAPGSGMGNKGGPLFVGVYAANYQLIFVAEFSYKDEQADLNNAQQAAWVVGKWKYEEERKGPTTFARVTLTEARLKKVE